MYRQAQLEGIGERLWVERAERGLTLRQAAKLAGIHENALRLIENGQNVPRAETLGKIAAGYGMSVHDLIATPEVRRRRPPTQACA
jgi:transcriptional regulator with XRE-family HTH domain